MLRLLLRGSVALVALVACCVSSASHSCDSHAGDALLSRVDAHLATCLPPQHARALDAFKDALVANELETSQRRPLAVVALASSSALLDRFAAAVATAVAGVEPSAPLAVRVLDLHAAAPSAHELTRALRRDMATALAACAPHERTLFLVRGLERARGDKLPLLDVFLDPLNGERATLFDADRGRNVDCRRALFVFLYERARGEHVPLAGTKWREFLVDKWQLASEAFTPQALAGRLTTAVVLSDDDEDTTATTSKDAAWKQTCELDGFLSRLREAQRRVKPATTRSGASTGLLGSELLPSQSVSTMLGLVVLVLGLVFVSAKSFVARSKQQATHVEVLKATKSKKKQQAKQTKRRRSSHGHEQPDLERIASLRSHCGTPSHHEADGHSHTPVAVPLAPASPVLAPAATAPELKSASPDPKTPTPTKPKRTGRGRKASASTAHQTTATKMATRQSRRT